jgi:hypothetical protein
VPAECSLSLQHRTVISRTFRWMLARHDMVCGGMATHGLQKSNCLCAHMEVYNRSDQKNSKQLGKKVVLRSGF